MRLVPFQICANDICDSFACIAIYYVSIGNHRISIDYGHTHLRYKQIFVIEYINNDFYLVKTIDYRPNELVPYGNSRESENKLKEPITFSKVNIAKIMLDYSGISEDA